MPRHLLLSLLLLACAGLARAETYRIGAEDDWYPFSAWHDGEVRGMSVDLVRAALEDHDTSIEFASYPLSRCLELTRSGQLAACLNTTQTPGTLAAYLLPQEALFSDEVVLWARHGSPPLAGLGDIAGSRVAVTLGYTYGHDFENIRDIQRVPVRRDLNGFLMLQRGRVDYMLAFRSTTQALLHRHPELAGQFAPVASVYRPQLYLIFSRYHPQAPELLRRFDQGMRRIKDDGRYQHILEHWQHPATPPH